jgi:hypothetical protein
VVGRLLEASIEVSAEFYTAAAEAVCAVMHIMMRYHDACHEMSQSDRITRY